MPSHDCLIACHHLYVNMTCHILSMVITHKCILLLITRQMSSHDCLIACHHLSHAFTCRHIPCVTPAICHHLCVFITCYHLSNAITCLLNHRRWHTTCHHLSPALTCMGSCVQCGLFWTQRALQWATVLQRPPAFKYKRMVWPGLGGNY